jgi:hypothetical protein
MENKYPVTVTVDSSYKDFTGVEQAKEMPMDLTISSHDTRRECVACHIAVAAMLIPLVFGFLSSYLVVPL